MEIRANEKDILALKKIKSNSSVTKPKIEFTIDESCDAPILTTLLPSMKQIITFATGMDSAKAYIKYGYDRIIKQCPLIKKKCIAEKCQFYQILGETPETQTGDCVFNWSFFTKVKQNK